MARAASKTGTSTTTAAAKPARKPRKPATPAAAVEPVTTAPVASKTAPTKLARSGPRQLSGNHKAALAVGRTESRAVRNYLEAIEASKGRRGRKRTPEAIADRLGAIVTELDGASPVDRLRLIQERLDLQAVQGDTGSGTDFAALEAAYIAAAKGYSVRKGVSYVAWRALDVPSAVLRQAGIGRSRES